MFSSWSLTEEESTLRLTQDVNRLQVLEAEVLCSDKPPEALCHMGVSIGSTKHECLLLQSQQKRESKTASKTGSYKHHIITGVTSHFLCHNLLVRNKCQVSATCRAWTPEQRVIEVIFGSVYQMPWIYKLLSLCPCWSLSVIHPSSSPATGVEK